MGAWSKRPQNVLNEPLSVLRVSRTHALGLDSHMLQTPLPPQITAHQVQ